MNDESTPEIPTKSLVTLIVIFITIAVMFGYFIYVTLHGTTNTIFTKLKNFYGMSLSNISIALLIAFLVSNVVSSFNVYLMTPLVQSVFPGEDIWQQPIHLPRDKIMYPGLFFQACVGFVLSIGMLFVLYFLFQKLFELIVYGKSQEKRSKISEIIMYGIILIIYLILLIWNAVEILKTPPPSTLPPVVSNTNNQQQRIVKTINQKTMSQPYTPLNNVYIPPNYEY